MKKHGKRGSAPKNAPRGRERYGREDKRKDSRRGFEKESEKGSEKRFEKKKDHPARHVAAVKPVRPEKRERPFEPPKPRFKAALWGIHACRAALLNPERAIRRLYVTEQERPAFEVLLEEARVQGRALPAVQIVEKADIDRSLPREAVHQGVAMDADPLPEIFVQDLIAAATLKERSVFVILDQVTDPHNVGAILRSACAFGADGVVMQRRHAPEIDGVAAKAASGAADYLRVAYETNLSRTIEIFQEAGYIVIGLDERGEKDIGALKGPPRAVLVLGAEGAGMRHLVREHCDVLVRLPTGGPVGSLNVSNAAAVALYAIKEA